MNQLSNFGLGVLLGIVGLYGAMHYTVVQANDGLHVIPKLSPKLENPYLDVRNFGLEQWQRNQSLALAVVRADKGYLLKDPSLLAFRENVQNVLTRIKNTTQNGTQNAVASNPTPERNKFVFNMSGVR